MQVTLAYGRTGLPVEFPDGTVDVVEPAFAEGLPDPAEALRAALRNPLGAAPLRGLAKPHHTVAIVFSDITRPAPNHLLVPAILSELDRVLPRNITLINALGLHRENTADELARMLGPGILDKFRVISHRARDPAELVRLGVTASGRPVVLNRHYVNADIRIATGFIEPHFFAGFSGGSKSILPGVAGEASILRNHDTELIGDPHSTWGETARNRILQESREATRMAPPDMILDVTLNNARQITGIFCGELAAAHDAGCAFSRQTAMRAVDQLYDVVVTSNGGWPLDINLYQAVKGISAAARVVKDGGDIIIAAECSEGVGHGEFAHILAGSASVEAMLAAIASPGRLRSDQWQAQILGNVLRKARVHVHSRSLSDSEVREAKCEPCPDIGRSVAELIGGDYAKRVCVLPQGPLTIPYIRAAVPAPA